MPDAGGRQRLVSVWEVLDPLPGDAMLGGAGEHSGRAASIGSEQD